MSAIKFQPKRFDPLERKAAASIRHRLKEIKYSDSRKTSLNTTEDDFSDIHDIWETDENNEDESNS